MAWNSPLPLANANVSASPTDPLGGFTDPTAPLRNETWLLPPERAGVWTIALDYRFTPSTLLLRNVPTFNSSAVKYGTKFFSVALPNENGGNDLVDLDYDYMILWPNGTERTSGACPAGDCLLPERVYDWAEYDFRSNVSISSLSIIISQWIGEGGGLGAFQLWGHIDERNVDDSPTKDATNSATPLDAPATSLPATASGSAVTSMPTDPTSLSTGTIAGVSVGCVAAVALLVAGAWFFMRRRRKARALATAKENMVTEGNFSPPGGRHEMDAEGFERTKYMTEAGGTERSEMDVPDERSRFKELGVCEAAVSELPAEVATHELNGGGSLPKPMR